MWDNKSSDVFSELSQEEKRIQLYLRQKKLLDTFLEHNAITPAQYQKSLGDLTEKMGIDEEDFAG